MAPVEVLPDEPLLPDDEEEGVEEGSFGVKDIEVALLRIPELR